MNPFVVGISNIFWTKYGIDSNVKKCSGTFKSEHLGTLKPNIEIFN